MDRETWDRFRARLKADELRVGDGLRAIIDHYIRHGLNKSQKKDKP